MDPGRGTVVNARRNGLRRTALLLLLMAAAGFLAGLLVGRQGPRPEEPARKAPAAGDPLPHHGETDVAGMISLRSAEDVVARREALRRFLWGEEGFPAERMPDGFAVDFHHQGYLGMEGLASVDLIHVSLEHGIETSLFHFHPVEPNGGLVVFCEGHGAELRLETPARFLAEGYSVLAVVMPLYGQDPKPVADLGPLGRVRLESHDHLRLLDGGEGSAVRLFVEPIAAALNHLEENFDYHTVAITGISGGGWLATLYAAIDPRVEASYPVAGTLPIFLRSKETADWGDYEQNLPELYRVANYLELYVLGAHGEGRRQIQVLNRYDDCCFGGTRARLYEDEVGEAVERLGPGRWELLLDESHREHAYSERALQAILDDLERE